MCGCTGRPRTLTFHVTGVTAGGSSAGEVRVGPRMERPFLIRSVTWVPVGSSTPGQFFDLLVSADDDGSDVAAPTGQSVFQGAQGLSGAPAGDGDAGLPAGNGSFEVPSAYRVEQTGRTLKVVTRYQAPALAAPAGHVVVVVDEYDAAPPPIVPRPPVVEPPPVVPPPDGGGGGGGPEAPVVPVPPSLPPPTPRVPASYPNLVAMSLSNCIPRGLGVLPRTGAGPGGVVCPPPSGYPPPAPTAPALPLGLAGISAMLAQRYTGRV